MRNVTIEDLHNGAYAISTEFHDGIVYSAASVEEAVKKYEADRDCAVGSVTMYGEAADINKQFSFYDF